MISVKDLHKSFGGVTVLDGISTDIREGGRGVHHRPLRQRQIHLSAVPEPAGDAGQRADPFRRRWT